MTSHRRIRTTLQGKAKQHSLTDHQQNRILTEFPRIVVTTGCWSVNRVFFNATHEEWRDHGLFFRNVPSNYKLLFFNFSGKGVGGGLLKYTNHHTLCFCVFQCTVLPSVRQHLRVYYRHEIVLLAEVRNILQNLLRLMAGTEKKI